jgi:hypothetical protein
MPESWAAFPMDLYAAGFKKLLNEFKRRVCGV